MQKPSERHNLTSDNNVIKFKKPVHDPFKQNNIFDHKLTLECVRPVCDSCELSP